jgi:2-beta-glucuronyltransferase
MLVDRFREINRDARYVYRVSDDLRTLRAHALVRAIEGRVLSRFELVSVPSQAMFDYLSRYSDNVRLQHHGIDKAAFDAPGPSPYPEGSATNAVFTGIAHLDREFLAVAAAAQPSWRFHIFGPFSPMPAPNVVMHGEVPFRDTVAYIAHADVGLATINRIPHPEVFSDSLKVIQFTYARLPIIVPDFIKTTRSNAIEYVPGDTETVRNSLMRAAAFDRSTISREGILSWDELAASLAGTGVE